MSKEVAEKNVARGVEWLNENVGKDWPDFIDTEKLDLASQSRCILGQTFEGGFSRAVDVLVGGNVFTSSRWAGDHGFDVSYQPVNYRDLNEAWLEYIEDYQTGLV